MGQYLFRLLESDPAYRQRWEPHARTRADQGVSQAAVARVLADHLVDVGERSVYDERVDRSLKDRVARAGCGRLSAETLRWLIEAFHMRDDHARHLWHLYTAAVAPGAVVVNPCRTVAVHELHHVGADRLPAWHRTVQVLRAEVDGVTHHRLRFDAAAASVEVLRGGSNGPLHRDGEGLWCVDLDFGRTLDSGDTVSLEYVTRFAWSAPPPPQLRRAAAGRIDNVELRVQFDPDCLPAEVRWAEWDGLDGPVRSAQTVPVDAEHSVHRYLERVEASVVGFTWDWDRPDR